MATYQNQAYPNPNEIVFSPSIPFWGTIPGRTNLGRMIEIKGKVPYGADIFQVNLSCGKNLDTPFHLSIRFHNHIVVRNTRINKEWGSEERNGGFPFATGKEFMLIILIQMDCYYIAVNSVHCWKYAHRLPFDSVKMLNIDGSVIIEKIQYGNQGGQGQAIDCVPTCPNMSSLMPIYNPKIPLTYHIANGLQSGFMIYFSARPSASVQRFSINLQCGSLPYPTPDIAFHFDVRYYNKSIVRNTRKNDKWGDEELSVPYFPFQPAVNFDMIIRVENDKYMVAVNGQHFIEYRHRMFPLSQINTLVVEKDIIVTSVRFG